MDAKILLEYSQALRDRYLEQLTKLPWEEIVKSRGGSFDSLRDIFLHTVDAEDRLVNYVIPGRTEHWISQSPDEFRDIVSISKRAKEVESKTKAYVAKLNSPELERKVQMPRRGAREELIALLWQIDVEPPHMGWIGYLQR